MEFQVGDEVKWGEEVGIVKDVVAEDFYPIKVLFTGGPGTFTESGLRDKFLENSPKLELVNRPKKKVKKRFWKWAYKDNFGMYADSYYFMDESGTGNAGPIDPALKIKREGAIKLENVFIDIEVEE
jgi:hypothetical protein